MEKTGEWQEELKQRGFYELDAEIERIRFRYFGLMDIELWTVWLTNCPERSAYEGIADEAVIAEANHFAVGRTDELFGRGTYWSGPAPICRTTKMRLSSYPMIRSF